MLVCPAHQKKVTADARVRARFFYSITSLFPATAIYPINVLTFLLIAIIDTPLPIQAPLAKSSATCKPVAYHQETIRN
jgi:hypothetical protein